MKISNLIKPRAFVKIRKDEWDELNRKVDRLEQYSKLMDLEITSMVNNKVEGMFDNKVRTYVVKMSKDEILAEARNIAMNNLFKEEE